MEALVTVASAMIQDPKKRDWKILNGSESDGYLITWN